MLWILCGGYDVGQPLAEREETFWQKQRLPSKQVSE